MTFKIGDKTFQTKDFAILRLIKEAAKKKDTGAVMVMLAAGEAFGVVTEVTTQTARSRKPTPRYNTERRAKP